MTEPESIKGENTGQETAAAVAAEQVAQLEDRNKLLEIKVAKLEKTGKFKGI